MKPLIAIMLAILVVSTGFSFSSPSILPVGQTLRLEADAIDAKTIQLKWIITPGYEIYRDKIHIESTDDNVQLGKIDLPRGFASDDKLLGFQEVYADDISFTIPVAQAPQGIVDLKVQYQGCKKDIFCYPPVTKHFKVQLAPSTNEKTPVIAPAKNVAPDSLLQLKNQNNLILFFMFIGFGVLLAFTPCVLPMIPIILGLVLGQDKEHSIKKRFCLTLTYVFGICVVYSAIGAIIGYTGEALQSVVQTPTLIIATCILFVILGLALLDVFHLQLPSRLQNYLNHHANQRQAGTYISVFLMGLISALIVSPCLSAPLAAVLSYIGTTGNIMTGSTILFGLGFGIGIPLLIVACLGVGVLPKSGHWLNSVKHLLGYMMFGLAIYLVSRLIPASSTMALIGILIIMMAIHFSLYRRATQPPKRIIQLSISVITIIYGVCLIIGGLSGSNSLVHPLKQLNVKHQEQKITYPIVNDLTELNALLDTAKQHYQPVILDFFADWCVECQLMDRYLQTPKIQQALGNIQLIKVDITNNDSVTDAVTNAFQVQVPPTMIFISASGKFEPQKTQFGYIDEKTFLKQLNGINTT